LTGGASSQAEARQHRRGQVCGRRRDIEGLSQLTPGPFEQGQPFFRNGPPLELLLIGCACTLAPLDSAEILIQRQRKEKTAYVVVSAGGGKSATQVRKLCWSSPDVVDDEVTVAKPLIMRDEQRNRRVQECRFIDRRREVGNKLCAAKRRTRVNASLYRWLGARAGRAFINSP
jgi:hypothetical protein